MKPFEAGTTLNSNNLIFDDSNMKLVSKTDTKVMEREISPGLPNQFSHALKSSNDSLSPEALSRIETSLSKIIEKAQELKFRLSDFKHVMKKTRTLGAETATHETGIAARMYAKEELTNLIILLRDLYRKY